MRLALIVAALKNLDILACDVQNTCLTSYCREKIYVIVGPEFGLEKGKIMIVKKALYRLKISRTEFRSLLAKTIWKMGHRPSRDDPDV